MQKMQENAGKCRTCKQPRPSNDDPCLALHCSCPQTPVKKAPGCGGRPQVVHPAASTRISADGNLAFKLARLAGEADSIRWPPQHFHPKLVRGTKKPRKLGLEEKNLAREKKY
jgi:hypothetical protein